MENKNLLWQSSAKKAFYGFTALCSCWVISSMGRMALMISVMNGGYTNYSFIFGIISVISLFAAILYYIGINGIKNCTLGSLMGNDVAKLSKGSLLLLISIALGFTISALSAAFSLAQLGLISNPIIAIISIVAFYFTYKGFVNISKLPVGDEACKGAKQLSVMSILAIIVYVSGLLPMIGNIINLLLSIAILAYTIVGWKKFSLATIEALDNMTQNDEATVESQEIVSQDEATTVSQEIVSQEEEEAINDSPEEKESSFLLNRWISKLAKWFDSSVFKLDASSSLLCVASLWVGILAGASIAVVSMINDDTSFEYWALGAAGAIILPFITVQAIKDIKKLSSGGQIVGRLAYLILLPLTLAFIGGILAAIAIIVVAVILFLWLLLTMLFGSNNKVKLNNGDVVRDDGLIGGYRGKSGNKYKKNLDGTFSYDD